MHVKYKKAQFCRCSITVLIRYLKKSWFSLNKICNLIIDWVISRKIKRIYRWCGLIRNRAFYNCDVFRALIPWVSEQKHARDCDVSTDSAVSYSTCVAQTVHKYGARHVTESHDFSEMLHAILKNKQHLSWLIPIPLYIY